MPKQSLSCEAAERIRKSAEIDTPQEFSIRLGYSHYAYQKALSVNRITRRMSDVIRRRFWRHVEAA